MEPTDTPSPLHASPSFGSLRVAALESRRSEDMSRLIERFGGNAFVSPSMREVAVEEPKEAVDFAYRVITGEIGVVIFLTGVGFRHLVHSIERHLETQRFLDALSDVVTVARGPKPVAAMREVGLTPTHRVPEPNTWRDLLRTLDQHVPLANQTVGLQEYGVTNHSLIAGLEARGAKVVQLRVYQWDFPEDLGPLKENLEAILAGERDVLLLTSAHQLVNLFRLADQQGQVELLRKSLQKMVVGSIGPTTSEMAQQMDVRIDVEPEHPKMGHLVQAAAEASVRILQARNWSVRLLEEVTEARQLQVAEWSKPGSIPAWEDSPMMRACRRQAAPVTPVWMMRQAGRYMEEYRKVRSKVGFLELCRNPQLCAEVMATAVERLGVDAAILFSDLLPILEPMGMELEFTPGDGPVIHNPLRSSLDVDRVIALESVEPLQYVMDAVRMTRAAIPANLPLIGFAGAPFTLASYMIEGGSSRSYTRTKKLMHADPSAWECLMQKLTESIARYLNGQILAGAQIVQIFDSWVGCLGPSDYQRSILPHMQQLLASILPQVPVILFGTGNPMLLPFHRGDDRTVVGIDWRIDLVQGWQMAGEDRAVQGNLDPTALLGTPESLDREIRRVLQEAGHRSGHIFNLGHGILPETSVDQARRVVDRVHQWSAR